MYGTFHYDEHTAKFQFNTLKIDQDIVYLRQYELFGRWLAGYRYMLRAQ